MKRIRGKTLIVSVLVFCMIVMSIIPVSAASTVLANGKCGANLTWSLDSTGVLSISGSGSMYDYSEPTGSVTSGIAPWWRYRNSIRQVIVGSQVTSIGENAFGSDLVGEYGYNNLISVTLGSGITSIKDCAFVSAYHLKNVSLNNGLKTIGVSAFFGTAIEEVHFPSTLVSIGDMAYFLTKMKSVDIPPSVSSIGTSALGYNCPCEGGATPLKGFTVYGYAGSTAEKYYKDMLRRYNEDRNWIKSFPYGVDSTLSENFTPDGTVYFVSLGSNPNGVPFGDVPENSWFYKGVKYVYDQGLMNGVSKGCFAPSDKTTRAMIVTILWRLNGQKPCRQSGFRDVSTESWYYDAVNWAAANGIVSGYSSSQFGPNDPVTREQMAVILYRYSQYCGKNTSTRASLTKFQDRSAISAYAKDAMAWAVGTGLVTGVTDTKLDPQGSAVRAQSATILMRYSGVEGSIIKDGISSDLKIGDIVTFGSYEQDNNLTNGKEPIEWIVLKKENGKALLLSKYGLDCQPYNEKEANVIWETCTLRRWLNSTFLNAAFSSSQLSKIQTTTVQNPDIYIGFDSSGGYVRNNTGKGITTLKTQVPGGNATQDQVFLLGHDESKSLLGFESTKLYDTNGNSYNGFPNMQASVTAYAKAKGVETNSVITTAEGKAGCWWWLRSPGGYSYCASAVYSDGGISYAPVDSHRYAVRPALWVNIAS